MPPCLRDAGRLLDDQRRHAGLRRVGRRIGLHEHGHEAGARAVRDPHLLAVDDELVALAAGRRADRPHVRAGLGLGHHEAADQLARGELREVALLLLLRAVPGEHAADDVDAVDDAGDRHPAARELRDRERIRRQVEPEAAVLLGDAHAEEAHLAQAVDDLLRVGVARLEVMRDRDDLVVDELADDVQDVELLVPEVEAVEAADPLPHARSLHCGIGQTFGRRV